MVIKLKIAKARIFEAPILTVCVCMSTCAPHGMGEGVNGGWQEYCDHAALVLLILQSKVGTCSRMVTDWQNVTEWT